MDTIENQKGARIRRFFNAEAQALRDKFLMMETLIPAVGRTGSGHVAEEGRYLEALLRDFLNKHLPSDVRAYSGFILRPATKTGVDDLRRVKTSDDEHSTQLDVIIYDISRFPIYERFEEFVVVPPEGVIGIVSVKKTLRLADLTKELNSLRRAASLCEQENIRGPYLACLPSKATAFRQKD
jgi:hypothetical protein